MQATHQQLHVLNWAIRSFAGAQLLADFMAGNAGPEQAIVRFEPALDRATALAHGLGFVTWDKRYWTLTAAGQELREALKLDDNLLAQEKSLLDSLPNLLTQAQVSRLLSRGVS